MFHKLKEVKYFKEIKCFKIVQKEEVYIEPKEYLQWRLFVNIPNG